MLVVDGILNSQHYSITGTDAWILSKRGYVA